MWDLVFKFSMKETKWRNRIFIWIQGFKFMNFFSLKIYVCVSPVSRKRLMLWIDNARLKAFGAEQEMQFQKKLNLSVSADHINDMEHRACWVTPACTVVLKHLGYV